MLKLPKSWESDPQKGRLLESLDAVSKPLRATGEVRVPHIELTEPLRAAISFARRCGKARGGLENIETLLQREEAGYTKVEGRGIAIRPTAITRVLVLSDDGSDRFYRHCETLLTRHAPRVLCLRLSSSSTALGAHFFGKESAVKALLVEQKEHVDRVLKSLVPAS